MAEADSPTGARAPDFAAQVKGAVIWRSGSQIAGQLIAWTSTFLVIRLLEPSDYGLVAMTGVILVLLNLFNGWGFANALVRDAAIDEHRIGQTFGMLILLNGALAAMQLALAPLAADYFHHPAIADLLRFQALFYVANPFIALGNALLSRRMDFRRPAQVNLAAAVLSALTALACAYAGLGVWTLVAAPFVLWYAQAIGLAIVARLWIRPVFSFRGAGSIVRYGGAMILVQFFWFLQSQADIFLAGRQLDAHTLGLYTTALFLTQILAAKFVPPLNEVAFAAYSRIQNERERVQLAFLKTVRLIMLIALPFYLGLAVTAEPLVVTLLGVKWAGAAPLVPVLACAMPLTTLQILFAPATNALGRERLAVRVGITGAVVMPAAFLIGLNWGIIGLAWAWLGGMAALLAATVAISLPALGIRPSELARALAPGLGASLAMAAAVKALDALLPALGQAERLVALVPFGAAVYGGLLFLFARPLVEEMLMLVRPPRAARTV
jgi:O-antigen/teichoic acid export membrane protein